MIRRFIIFCWVYVTMMSVVRVSGQSLQLSVTEEVSPGTIVVNLRSDANLLKFFNQSVIDNLWFVFLHQTNHTNHLSIDSATGLVRTVSSLDRDRLCPGAVDCLLKVDVAVQPAKYFIVIKLTIEITDLNDNEPRFPQSLVQRYISENLQPGAVIPIPAARDPDSPSNGVIEYYLRQHDGDSDSKFRLVVDRNPEGTFDVSLVLKDTLDREALDLHRMTVVARDGGVPSKSGSALVEVFVTDENDNAPQFDRNLYSIDVPENTPVRRSLLRLYASDRDEGSNAKVLYRLSSKSSLLYGSLFSVDKLSGWVSLIGRLDFESNSSMILEVLAENEAHGTSPSTAIVRVNVLDVNDNVPEVRLEPASDGFLSVKEHCENNTVIAAVSVFDPDAGSGGKVDCLLQKNDESEPSHFKLELVAEKEYTIVTTSDLDRELADSFQLVLICSDGGQPVLASRKNLLILVEDINDHDPQFSQPFYNISVMENNKLGEILLRVTATDTDSGKNSYVVYKLDSGTDPRFTIDRLTGEISTLLSFDREHGDIYQFRVTASDRGTEAHNSTSRVVIHILDDNDEPPRFRHPEYTFNVSEDVPVGSAIGQLVADDLDLTPNNRHSFHHLDASDNFQVDRESGTVFLQRVLDREVRDKYRFTVSVKDVGEPKFEDRATVKVNVDDVNDNSPVIVFPSEDNNTVFVSKAASVGRVVAKVVAMDPDLGENARMTFAMEAVNAQRSTEELFAMDPKLGNVVVNSDLSDHDQESIDLQIIVHDGGTPSQTSYATLRVSIATPADNYQSSDGFSILLVDHFLLIVIGGTLAGLVTLVLLIILVCCCSARGRCCRKRPLIRTRPLDKSLMGSQVLRVDDDISRRSVTEDANKVYGFSHRGGAGQNDDDDDGITRAPRIPSYDALNRPPASDEQQPASQTVMRDAQFNSCRGCDANCSLVSSPHHHQHQQPHDSRNIGQHSHLSSNAFGLSRSPQLGSQGRWTPPSGRMALMNDLLTSGGVRSSGLFVQDPYKPRQVYDDLYFNSGESNTAPFDAPSWGLSYENGHLFHSMERPKRRQFPACNRVNYQLNANSGSYQQHPVIGSCSNLA